MHINLPLERQYVLLILHAFYWQENPEQVDSGEEVYSSPGKKVCQPTSRTRGQGLPISVFSSLERKEHLSSQNWGLGGIYQVEDRKPGVSGSGKESCFCKSSSAGTKLDIDNQKKRKFGLD